MPTAANGAHVRVLAKQQKHADARSNARVQVLKVYLSTLW